MKIALLGYGKMGRLTEQVALSKGHQISLRFSPRDENLKDYLQELAKCDLAIDFSYARGVLNHLQLCLSQRKPLVIGTTGWEEQLQTAQHLVNEAQGSCLYAPNFSIGVFLFQQIVEYAASLFQLFSNYDVSGIEYHHQQKLDSPSGTAKLLAKRLSEKMPRLHDFAFSSVRCGHIPGTHTLLFDSLGDTVTLTHQARNREDFASGAVMAAEWLLKRKGFFTLEDMMSNLKEGPLN